jgi:hypothetical protein
MTGRAIVLAAALAAAVPGIALATTFRGAAVDDSQTRVKLRITKAGVVHFDYRDVLVGCTNGDEIREPGAQHSTMLGDDGRFKDVIVQDLDGEATGESFVKGRAAGRKAWGALRYGLSYEGGECTSGKLRWKAKRKRASVATAAHRRSQESPH